jgi:PKD repeat protein
LASGAIVRDREDLRITGNGINPPNTAIDFTYTPANPAPGQQVVFTATGATSGGVFKWKFPGDIRPVGNTVTFIFPTAGTFEVEVEIEHGATTSEVTRTVTVGGTPNGTQGAGPIDFTYSPANPIAGQSVTFTATGNTGGGTFKWKFPGDVRQSGSVVTFTFASNGSYEVELEVEHGIAAEITKIVTVGSTGTPAPPPPPPPASLNFNYSPSTPHPGDTITFTATGAPAGATYKWKFPGSNIRPTGAVVTYTFASAGSFEVELELEHAATPAQITKIITVSSSASNTGGNLDFTFSPTSPRAGQSVTFTATGNTNGGTYKWKFPDNSRPAGAVVTFTFATAGSFEVELEIEHGSTDAEVKKIVRVSP